MLPHAAVEIKRRNFHSSWTLANTRSGRKKLLKSLASSGRLMLAGARRVTCHPEGASRTEGSPLARRRFFASLRLTMALANPATLNRRTDNYQLMIIGRTKAAASSKIRAVPRDPRILEQKMKLRAFWAPLKITQSRRTQDLTTTHPKTLVFQNSKNAGRQ